MKTKIKTPIEVNARQQESLAPKFEELRKRINEKLDQIEETVLSATVDVEGFPPVVISTIKKECEQAGWQCQEERGGDNRDSYHNLRLMPAASPVTHDYLYAPGTR